MSKPFPFFEQHEQKDCGAACLKMIAKFHGRGFGIQQLNKWAYVTREGASFVGLAEAAERIGFRSTGVLLTFDKLRDEATLPALLHWEQNHFVVAYKVTDKTITIADPEVGLRKLSKAEFMAGWASTKREGLDYGAALLLSPTPAFYQYEEEKSAVEKGAWAMLWSYVRPYKRYVNQVVLSLIIASLVQLILPFLTQSIVDVGIQSRNLSFIYLILAAQLMLFASRATVDFIRSWILLHLTTRINISIISDFLIKLMKLPMSFYDSKMTGDLLQRIDDHERLQELFDTTSLNALFSFFSIIAFSVVLSFYSPLIFLVFLAGSLLYAAYITLFLKRRRELDYEQFAQDAKNQSALIELIGAMQEIKLNNVERKKRWQWEGIQAKLFRLDVKSMALEQYQEAGALFITEVKNIIITFLAATAVINGELTLGAMLAISYIIGQMSSPLNDLVDLIREYQDAKISLDRIREIYSYEEEEEHDGLSLQAPIEEGIELKELSFRYGHPASPLVLDNVSLTIKPGQTTAIVGSSGSGKTTLLKLLLKFYEPTEGNISLGDVSLSSVSSRAWRNQCAAVMQEGYIFSDSIAWNICASAEDMDMARMIRCAKLAEIDSFVSKLPNGYNTVIGEEGLSLSQGQKQRILIARALYKEPAFVFFDEATSALDAINEKVILENLEEFFSQRTTVVVAHRLSTVKNADQIAVLDSGNIVEVGTHEELVKNKGVYYTLVKNQLELGS